MYDKEKTVLKRERLQWLQPTSSRMTRQQQSPHRNTHVTKRRKLQFDERKAKQEYKPPPTMLDGKVVRKLDPTNSEEAQRIYRRKRVVAFGKNTIGK